MTSQPSVFLVDDDQSVRDALKWLLESVGLHVETYCSAADFLEHSAQHGPGCLVLDVRMPGTSGLELLEQLRVRDFGMPVIVVTGHGDVPMCVRAFEGGAFAFLEKPINQQQLLDYVQRAIDEDRKQRETTSQPALQERIGRLTPREREVMDLLVEGRPMKQIATRLSISIPTCSKHRARVLEKLDVDNDVELVRLFLTSD